MSFGALPAGLTLTSAGVLSGTPTTPGSSTVTIRGTDANGCFATVTHSLTIVAGVPTLPQVFAIMLALALAYAQAQIEVWRVDYNMVRPHSALDDQTLHQFAESTMGARRPRPARACEDPDFSVH